MKKILLLLMALASLTIANVSQAAPPLVAIPAEVQATATAKDVIVWVNSKSQVYHYASSVWYGRTVHGYYAKESTAKAEGNRAAANE
jgi:hypothetical protein